MAAPQQESPVTEAIIIIKKKGGHAAHHGGAWKVAYADFVTAMMALFIVLWLMNSSEPVKEAVSGYFKDPSGKGSQQGTGQGNVGENIGLAKTDMKKLKEKLEQAMKQTPELKALKDQVEMTVTGEGLRIELLESDTGTFFKSGNALPTGSGTEMLEMLAGELGKIKSKLLIEGHTDAKPYVSKNGYSNWELSTDRANAARKLMQAHGLNPDQVGEVRGFGAQQLRKPEEPDSSSNRRVTIVVKYLTPVKSEAAAASSEHPSEHAPAHGSEHGSEHAPEPSAEHKEEHPPAHKPEH